MNKMGLWLVLLQLSGFSGASHAEGVNLNFSGALIDKQCSIDDAEGRLKVDMLSRSLSFFHRHPRTETITFDIILKNCSSATASKLVQLTFNGANLENVGNVKLLKTDGNTGILIGLEDTSGQLISIGDVINAGKIKETGQGSENSLRFGAYAQAPRDLSTLKEGAYNATAAFQIAFQ